ncbi:MAG: 4-hydroxy-tetrahydrodipicolinate reductase [Bacteroidia bacterium]
MKIALIGYGSMGKTIEEVCKRKGHEIVLILDEKRPASWKKDLKNADVAIEFTTPEAAEANMLECFKAGVPVVTGTTGWYQRFEEVKDACEDLEGGLFYATNFSIGVNLFFQLNRILSRIMATHHEYQARIHEEHHLRKKDAPSGTAISIAEGIIAEHPAYIRWAMPDKSLEGDLEISSLRDGDIPGTHEIFYRSADDEISIKHQAFGRKGFAEGAVVAAEFLASKRRGIYTMSDLINVTEPHGL